MYNSFDMACHDEDTALRLNIKVNSENLLPTQQKYNLGSLRLPADPSWPKIPQRRLVDHVGDPIQLPYIVTVTDAPSRNQAAKQIPQSQSCKLGTKDSGNFTPRHYCGKTQHSQSQQSKKKGGCTDPRFRKVKTVKSQMTSTDFREHEIAKQTEINRSISEECKAVEDKTVPWKDTTRAQIIQQVAEKPDETKATESIGVQTVQPISEEVTSELNQMNTNEYADSNKQNLGSAEFKKKSCSPVRSARSQFKLETSRPCTILQNNIPQNSESNAKGHSHQSTNLKEDTNSFTDMIPQTSLLQRCQGKEGQFLLDIDKKIQTTNEMPVENLLCSKPELKGHCAKHCYNVQVPVLSYQNVPVQISINPSVRADISLQLLESTNPRLQSADSFNKIKIPKLELPKDSTPQVLNSENIRGKPFCSQEMRDLGFELKLEPGRQTVQIGSQKNHNNLQLQQHKQFLGDGKHQFVETCNKTVTSPQQEINFEYESNESNILLKPQLSENHKPQPKSSPEMLMENIYNEEECWPQQNVTNIFQDSVPKHNFHIYYHQNEPFQSYCGNEPQKFGDTQSPQYHIGITDSKSKRRENFMCENGSFNKQQEQLSKNENCIDGQQKIIDSESVQVLNCGNKQKNYSQPFKRRDKSYFRQKELRNLNSVLKCMTSPKYKQGKANDPRQQLKMKSEQHLPLDKKQVPFSESQITNGRRRSCTSYLKKANSCLSKCTQNLTPDSEADHSYQHQQRRPVSSHRKTKTKIASEDLNDVKREHCIKPYQRLSYKSAKTFSSLDLKRKTFSSHKSPRAETNIVVEKPTAIPVKTQQLLNKSYWEYYNKLKLYRMENGESPQQQYFCQVAMGAPQAKKRRAPELIVEESNNTSQTGDQVELSLPEIKTLEQCSVLSTMINKTWDSVLQPSAETIRTKQIYLNGNMRSSSDPTAGTQSVILKKLFPADNEDSIVYSAHAYKQNHKRNKHFDNKTSKLKSIGEHPVVFFGCMVYAMIIFLPMIYDYFSYEEHDEYEDMSYIEIALQYIIASFKEAFREFIDMANNIFFKPVRGI